MQLSLLARVGALRKSVKETRLAQVSLELVSIGSIQFIMRSVLIARRFKFITDLITDPIKTNSNETWASLLHCGMV